jgi:hypothetical protein
MMRLKSTIVLVLAMLLLPQIAFAQSTNAVWNRWDAQITVQSNNQLQIAETQEINVTGGTINGGTRTWRDQVQIQSVFVNLSNDQTPRALTKGDGSRLGTYSVTQSGSDETTLHYALPKAQSSGSTFVLQINYSAVSPTTGMVDWAIVPADHPFPVNSSTVHLRFPSGQAPDPSLARVSEGTGSGQMVGNDLVIQSQGTIPAGQQFEIQVPFGAGVGAAGSGDSGSGNTNPNFDPNAGQNPVGPVNQPGNGTTIELPGLGTILLLVCGAGLLLLFGGGSILRSLLGSFLGGGRTVSGGSSGSPFGGTGGTFGGRSSGNPPQTSDSSQRGFRPSSSQDREIGTINDDKDSRGGSSFN